ncbi:nuclear receptor coactivator 7-like [Teleopsis dalmanni]|uniref:nuclear receptor coactivator 7-like n=1 Tax=Teleopsis dalmanni TaxID=139649 RepID=UPI0018CE4885|nr:nuclear receptor coactivator 7-like [Teleopsis dalmanni]
MGKPIGKAIPLPTSVMSYGKNKLRPEYWFSVPKNRVDELYRFIKTWVPHLYGELNEEQIKERGFELIQDDTEWTKSGTRKTGQRGSQDGEEISDLTRESWELIKAPFAKTYNIIKTASHAASHDLDLLGGEGMVMRKTSAYALPRPWCVVLYHTLLEVNLFVVDNFIDSTEHYGSREENSIKPVISGVIRPVPMR